LAPRRRGEAGALPPRPARPRTRAGRPARGQSPLARRGPARDPGPGARGAGALLRPARGGGAAAGRRRARRRRDRHRSGRPAAALELLDRLTARVPGARASTALCMVLEPTTGRLLWSRAGHLPALVVDDDGARYLDGPAGHGALLGLPPGRPPYTDGELTLPP